MSSLATARGFARSLADYLLHTYFGLRMARRNIHL